MADTLVGLMLQKLDMLIQKEVDLIWGVKEEMRRLSSLLSTIQAVLEDAEEKQVQDKALKNWLRKLKAAAYKVDDILDECATEAARLESYGQDSSLINKVHSSFFSYLHPHNLSFHHKIGGRMRDIRERLDDIAKERSNFHLIERAAVRRTDVTENRRTGSIPPQSEVYGRDEDKARVIESLVEKVVGVDATSVYPIIGLGGLGKTTLAQMVYNDERIRNHFELRMWYCVSENFNVTEIIKALIESATGKPPELKELDPLQRHLQNILNGKRYLLVLDDVWSDNQEKWDGLKNVLACGSRGASIIVTTRIETVAWTIGTVPSHHLSGLNEGDCWSLFKERAFKHKTEEHPNLVAIGKEIVKKCAGVPLAIKSLGSMMRYKEEESQWLSVMKSELWNLPQDEDSILPALRLSYSNLPSQLKQCFAYCAIFPKDFFIERELLIQLWIANDFISLTENLDPEDIGNEICNELCWRSFLQQHEENYFGNIKGFKMHDLMHDLAQFIMKDECLNEMVASSPNVSKGTHFSMVDTRMSTCSFLKSLYQVETLRTFLVHNTFLDDFIFRYDVSCDFSRLSSLRVLGSSGARLAKLSSSISRLSHLRYLDLSRTQITKLPKSIITLHNLQTLRLEGCYRLQKLPKHMKLLKNLRHFHLDGCSRLSHMPPQIGQITCLKTLTCFIVGKKRGCYLVELKRLNLGGLLHIKHLERMKNPLDAKEANLVGKQNLHQLYLSWVDDGDYQSPEDVEKALEALQPNANLKKICISGYKGVQFPSWMRDNILDNVVHIELSNCRNCPRLPPLALLPSLCTLRLRQISQAVYIDSNDQTSGMTTTGFPSLKSLEIKDLPSLERLSREDIRELLPRLTSLEIKSCPKFTLSHLPSVKELKVWQCTEVILGSISNFKNLISLEVWNNNELNYLPHGMLLNLSSLKILRINNFGKLKFLPAELVGLSALETLEIICCCELVSFLEQGTEGLKSLKYLGFYLCTKLTTLTEGIQHFSSLERLDLNYCPELVALPDGIKYLTSLRNLTLVGSDRSKLEVLPEALQYALELQSLQVSDHPLLASLPDWIGDLTSLQTLDIFNCPKLSSLPASIQGLTNLQRLIIYECSELQKRCQKDTGEDWYKIAHIPNVKPLQIPKPSSHIAEGLFGNHHHPKVEQFRGVLPASMGGLLGKAKTDVKNTQLPKLAPQFDGLNCFETLVGH